jgi:hypothetical protein
MSSEREREREREERVSERCNMLALAYGDGT